MKGAEDIYGLILAGGQNTRMGTDKSLLIYHRKPQVKYLFDLLTGMGLETFISVRDHKQLTEFSDHLIMDAYQVDGPVNGILSAMDKFSDKSLLVVAVDMPFVKEETIGRLIRERNRQKIATAFATKATHLPEPLAAIWESSAHALLKQNLENGKLGLRKFLLEQKATLVYPADDMELFNSNTPEEYKRARTIIR